MKKIGALLALLLVGNGARAEFTKEFPKVDDTSYAEPNGSRVIRLSIDIAAGADDIWQTLTTTEGWKSYAVSFASVDMQVGGIIETSYDPKAKVGDPDNIKNEIVAYVPGKMLAIRCVQAPRTFENKKEFFATSTVIELERIGEKKTRVVLTAPGYRAGEAYDSLYKKFRFGDSYTLENLRAKFEPKPTP